MSAQARRFIAAVAIVLVALAMAAASGAWERRGAESGEEVRPAGAAAVGAADSDDGLGKDDAAERIFASAGGGSLGSDGVPAWAVEELVDPDALGATEAHAREGVIGLVCRLPAADAVVRVREQLASRGWVEAPGGGEAGLTFVKESGRCRWAFALCQPVAGETSVVVVYQEAA